MNPARLALAAALLLSTSTAHAAGDGAIPLTEIALHAVNLTILLGTLGFFFGGKIKDALKTRALGVRKDIDESEKARHDARARLAELEARVAGFDAKLAAMKAEAEAQSQAERAVVLSRAEKDAALIKRTAEQSIRDEVRRARQSLREDAVALSIQLAEQRLQGALDPSDQGRLTGEFLGAVQEAPKNGVNHG
jgi:F-type H+-transporting ATPase subunit b